MKYSSPFIAASLASLMLMTPSVGLANEGNQELRQQLKSMSQEQRAAFREQVRDRWQALTPEQKQAFKDKVDAKSKESDRRYIKAYGMHLLKNGEISP